MASRTTGVSASLSHVLVCGGSTEDWSALTSADWRHQLDVLVKALAGSGVRWLTICPSSGDFGRDARNAVLETVRVATGGTAAGATSVDQGRSRVSFIAEGGLVCIVDVCADGRTRFVDAVNAISESVKVEESVLESTLFAPALADPDLVLIFGPATRLPRSLMWELAYSELVFLDTPWTDCNSEHVHMAIDDFRRRDRRFGGIDT